MLPRRRCLGCRRPHGPARTTSPGTVCTSAARTPRRRRGRIARRARPRHGPPRRDPGPAGPAARRRRDGPVLGLGGAAARHRRRRVPPVLAPRPAARARVRRDLLRQAGRTRYLKAGYELAWTGRVKDVDPMFTKGNLNVFQSGPDFVVHPPVGKWMIAAGEWLFGPTSSCGWRFSAALVGTLSIAHDRPDRPAAVRVDPARDDRRPAPRHRRPGTSCTAAPASSTSSSCSGRSPASGACSSTATTPARGWRAGMSRPARGPRRRARAAASGCAGGASPQRSASGCAPG